MSIGGKQIVEAISVIAIVLSLLFVAFELSQSNNIAVATNEIEIRNNYAAFNEAQMLNPAFSSLLHKAKDPGFVPSGEETIILDGFVFRSLNSWRPVLISYERGLLDPISYEAMFDDIRVTIEDFPAIHHLWRNAIGDYPSRANDPIYIFIDEVLNGQE